ANPTKWSFPSGTVAANSWVKVVCSGLNTVNAGEFHTNFKLTQCKPEMIVLSNPGGTIIDSLTIRRNQLEHSWGRTTDGANTWSVFLSPTYGTSNNAGTPYSAYATKPVFSLAPGYYPGTQSLSITTPDPNITIHYTTNGYDPTTSDPVYSTPLTISATQVVRARCFSSTPTIATSFCETNSYFIGVAVHTVATVSICGDQILNLMNGTQFFPTTELEYFDKSGTFRTEVGGTSNEHGNDSWAYNQRGIDFVSEDEQGYGYCLKWKLFHMTNRNKFQRVILKAAANDNYPFEPGSAHIRDAYCHQLSQQGNLHLDERSYEPCVMYVNGQYWGVYEIREKVDDNDFTNYYYNQDNPNLQMLQTWGGTWSAYGGAQAQTDWNTLQSFIVSNNMALPANWAHVDTLYNWKSLCDYVILNSICVTSDWLNWNTEWWRGLDPAGGANRWRYCLWDNDATFGHYINYTGIPTTAPTADPCNPEGLGDPGGQGHIPVLMALMANPTFKQYYISRYADLLNTSMSCDTMINTLDTMIAHIAPEMPAHIARWGGSVATWQGNVTTMRTYIQTRCTAIQQGMVNCYNLTGPYNVTFDVSPAGAGTIDVNSIHLDNLPWNGLYYGGIDIILKTAPTGTQYTFDHWEITTAVPTPSTTSDSVRIQITGPETVVAVYKTNEVLLNAFIPTAFSPNGDGQNDFYNLHGLDGQNFDFMVFNRWGQLVFETTSASTPWDGRTGGKEDESGVYAYVLKVTHGDGTIEEKTGNITLMR
ncbi:MAG TPA: CotH kinase family protein, partial [Bacteroidia bacterium]|nr:CotH kinase family protein [Bacteroidia bacterium]